MNSGPDGENADHVRTGADRGYSVDARGARGLQVGDSNTQIVYTYNLTWADGVAPPPLVSVSGALDSPYRGLAAFEERDAGFFFGRDDAAAQVLDRMSRLADGQGPLVISGASGAGKSSLLRAGVLPRLRGEGLVAAPEAASWPCLVFTPGRTPLDELAVRVALLAGVDAAALRRELEADAAGFALTARQAALAQQPASDGLIPGGLADSADHPPGRRLMLVVDQFEQVFTQCADEGERRAFIAALCAISGIGRKPGSMPAAMVILGVRADFEARCATYPKLAAAVQDRYLVTPMTERQLRTAITGPAKVAGSSVDDDLAEALMAEVGARQSGGTGAGVLPLLSHALDQTWRSRAGNSLTLADYERTGGIEGAVAVSAERAYGQLTLGQQAAARQVFTRLTATSPDGVDVADRATRAELTTGKAPDRVADVETVLEAFAAERLLTLAADSVEISHEALLTAWPLLRDTWLAATHADRIVGTALRHAASEWERHSHDPSYLYRGTLLEAAAEMADRTQDDPARNPPLSPAVRGFLHASGQARRRAARWRRGAIIGLVCLTLAAIVLAGAAIQDAASIARQHAIALSRQLAAESLATDPEDPATARRLALAAWQVSPTPQAGSALSTLVDEQQKDGMLPVASADVGVTGVAFSPDGKLMATVDGDGRVRLWNPATGLPAPVPLSAVRISGVAAIAFSPRGLLAAEDDHGHVRLWNPATGKPVGNVGSVLFGPDGTPVTLAKVSGRLMLRAVGTGRPIGSRIPLSPDVVLAGSALGPEGKLLAIGCVNTHGNGSIAVWNDVTDRFVRNVAPTDTLASPAVNGVAISPDGRLLASADADGTAEVWNISSGRPLSAPISADNSPNGAVNAVAFSPDGLLATADNDGTVRLWNPLTGQPADAPIPASTGRSGRVSGVTFSGDGNVVATIDNVAYHGSTVRLWNPVTGQPVGTPIRPGAVTSFYTIALSPDGKFLATTADQDNTPQVWNTSTGKPVWEPVAWASSVAFSPDGKLLAASVAGKIRLWNPATRKPAEMPLSVASEGGIIAVAFTADGTLLAADGDGTVREWNPARGTTASVLLPPAAGHGILADVFSPDGKFLATIGDAGTVRLWNLSTRSLVGPPLPQGPGNGGDIDTVAFSPDAKLLAIAYANGTVQLWNPATDKPVGTPIPVDTGTNASVNGIAFSPDGRILASADNDRSAGGTVQLWKIPQISNPYAALCAEVGPPTQAELNQYAPGDSVPAACA